MKAVGQRRMSAGFTLIELMIVVAVIAVLAGIAMYNYQAAVVRAKRSAATSCLQSGAQYMERYYTTYMSYNNASTPPALPQCDSGVANSYTVALAPSADGRVIPP
ncbi:type IV pilin protein, partial [Xanthomonas phaseoli]